MNKNLVIILGQHRLIRNLLETTNSKEKSFMFLSSLADTPKESGKKEGVDFWLEVVNKEIERDKLVLEELNAGKNVFIEQWHIGNLARIQGLGIELSQDIQNKISQQISSLSARTRVFYVSVDLEKYFFDSELEAKQRELNNLSKILRDTGIKAENLDGDATQENLKKRLHFLLEQI